MLSYPIDLQEDNGTVLASSPDFPELTTFGRDNDEALARAVGAIEEAIAARMQAGQDIPPPSAGGIRVTLSALIAGKATLYQEMRNRGVGKAELSRHLGWSLSLVDRVLDMQHRSRLDQIDAALAAIRRHSKISPEDVPPTSMATDATGRRAALKRNPARHDSGP